QVRREGDLGDHLEADAPLKTLGKFLQVLIFTSLKRPAVEFRAPVAPDGGSATLHDGVMPSRELPELLEHSIRPRYVAKREVITNGVRVHSGVEPSVTQNRLELRGEQEAAREIGVIRRLDAEPIACQEELPSACIIERKGKHSVKTRETLRAQILIEMEDHLAVRFRPKPVPSGEQLFAEWLIVVDLTVADQDERAILILERLMASSHIDDAEPSMAKADVVALEVS